MRQKHTHGPGCFDQPPASKECKTSISGKYVLRENGAFYAPWNDWRSVAGLEL